MVFAPLAALATDVIAGCPAVVWLNAGLAETDSPRNINQ